MAAYKKKEVIGDATLYLGDCLDILPTLDKVDAVITDPPYGVELGKKLNTNRDRDEYECFDDTIEYLQDIVLPAIEKSIDVADRALITCGVRAMHYYFKMRKIPTHVGSIYYPAATGCNAWGFSCWQPMLYYGKDPYGGKGSLHDSFQSTERAEKNGHPCPKPEKQMIWMVNRASKKDENILDPFMGSGTTGVACMNLGRKFIGIEISEKYFDIACERIDKAQRQGRLFG